MEIQIQNKKCDNHKEINIAFYCFDDNSNLCSKCFKEHKKHNIEIIDDLVDKDRIYKSLLATKLTFSEYYQKIKGILENSLTNIQKLLQILTKREEDLKNGAPPGKAKNIFSLSFQEYEHIGTILDINLKIKDISKKLFDATKILKKQNEYTNFRAINKEIRILEKSNDLPDFPIDIMFEKSNQKEYTLFDGASNHYIILNLGKIFFLKSIQIEVAMHDCSLKNFQVQTKKENEEGEIVNKFLCNRYNFNQGLQEFKIEKEAQFVRLDLIDTWGIKSGNFILIKRIFFDVADII